MTESQRRVLLFAAFMLAYAGLAWLAAVGLYALIRFAIGG